MVDNLVVNRPKGHPTQLDMFKNNPQLKPKKSKLFCCARIKLIHLLILRPEKKNTPVISKNKSTDSLMHPLQLFICLLMVRICSAIMRGISDCDETFNYWEPIHYLLYGKGFQTWEYSPVYAIRSYAYLWFYALPFKAFSQYLQDNKYLVFYFIRCLLAIFSTLCEVYFYK